jgi:glycosyltransferase involved in cell wall biosynthesis
LLDQTLTEMHKLQIPPGVEWELLIVNNNCTDDTDAVIQRHAKHLPIRRLFEPALGLSNARNCAVAAACGELLIWTDDDVLVAPEWLAEYAIAAATWPDAAFFGGPIRPWFEGEPPLWLRCASTRVADAYALRDVSAEPIALDNTHLPYGANFAVRTKVQKNRLYDSDLGVAPGRRMGGEETALTREMLRNGLLGRWVPTAKVRHFIPKSRQTINYLRTYYRGWGEYLAKVENPQECAKLFGKPRWAWRKAVENELKYRLSRPLCPPAKWIEYLKNGSVAWGYIKSYKTTR